MYNPFDARLKQLDEITARIHNGKIYGHYALEKAIEFVNKQIPDTKISSHEKLIRIINKNKDKLRTYLEGKVILDDPRRLTIYALLYTAWQMWDYLFTLQNLNSPLLKEILSYEENNKLKEFVQKYEDIGLRISLNDVVNILAFYEEKKNNSNPIRYETAKGMKQILTEKKVFEKELEIMVKAGVFERKNNKLYYYDAKIDKSQDNEPRQLEKPEELEKPEKYNSEQNKQITDFTSSSIPEPERLVLDNEIENESDLDEIMNNLSKNIKEIKPNSKKSTINYSDPFRL